MITTKPHHLIDIIKLYGAGVEDFKPDEVFQHDFYKVANRIIGDLNTPLQFTVYGDDICKPCNRFKNFRCIDRLENVKGYDSKDIYNQKLDTRLIDQLKLDLNSTYTVWQAVEILNSDKDLIFHVWIEEDDKLTEERNSLFQEGLKKIVGNA